MVHSSSSAAGDAPGAAGARGAVRVAWAAAGLSCVLGLTVLLGWAIQAPVLRSLIPGAVEMKANTALGLVGCSVAIFAFLSGRQRPWRTLTTVLSAAVLALGLATLAQYAFNWNLGIDELLVRDTGAAFNQAKGRMSPYSALVFALLGGGTLALVRGSAWGQGVARGAGGLVTAVGVLSLLGYLWNASEIVTDQIAPPVALNTALAFMALGGAVMLLARSAHGAADAGSRLERLVLGSLVPTVLFVVVGGGLVYQSASSFTESLRSITQGQGVRAEIGRLHAAVADAELAQQNHVQSRDPAVALAYQRSADTARRLVAQLGTLVPDNPQQALLQRELADAVHRHLQLLDAPGRANPGQAPGQDADAAGDAARRSLLAQIRLLSGRMDAAESSLLAARQQQAERQRRVTLAMLLLMLLVLTGLFLLLLRGIRREIQARNAAREAVQHLNEDLERRVAERTAAVSFQQAFLRRVIDLQRDFVYAKDRDGRFVLANQSLADALGTTVEQMVGQPQTAVMPKAEEAQGFHAADQAVIDGGREVVVPEETLTTAGGSVRHLFTVKRPIESAEGTTIVLGVSTDITERKAAEDAVRQLAANLERRVSERTADLHRANVELRQARLESEQASRAKSAFLANMSHEIRTPMNAIIGLTHIMLNETDDPRQRQRLGKVGDAAQHLLQVINDILDMSKIEAGKLTLHKSEFSVEDLLTGATAMVAQRARDKQLELIIDVDHLPKRMLGDAVRLSQIVINLLSNAVKFTEHGWVRLRTEVLQRNGAQLLVRFEVQDTGPGIAPEHQAALFTAFEQADSSPSRQHAGTGLGLALSRQFALAMGGDAGMTSTPGSGSTFWFSAWLERRDAPAAAAQPVALGGLRALVVDDLPEALVVIGAVLRMLGLAVDTVSSGAAALARVQAEQAAGRHYDVLVIDWCMQPLDGIDTLTRLRGLLGRDIPPSMLVTAHDGADMARRATAAHFDAVVHKPVTGSTMLDPLMRLLQGRRPPSRAGPQPPTGAQVRQRHAGRRVLLVEDNEVNREVASELLVAVGLQVDTASNGALAVEKALSARHDLVLMDMQMPVMDGLEATRAIRQRAAQHIPIIAITANAFVEDRNACLAAGMDDHLTKPVDPALLHAMLLRWLPASPVADGGGAGGAGGDAGAPAAELPQPALALLAERLRSVDGLDLAVALSAVGGQMPVLARVLARFAQSYRHGVPELLDASGSDADVVQRWRRSCHSLRGVLATVGAGGMLNELALLEQSLTELGAGGSTLSRDDLRGMGRHLQDDMQSLATAIERCLAQLPAFDAAG